jgi:hypothetical protein
MINIDQELWNFLFGFLGEQCMLPEGCRLPAKGTLVYIATVAVIVVFVHWRKKMRRKVLNLIEKTERSLYE